jgi:teichuronic acid exporter
MHVVGARSSPPGVDGVSLGPKVQGGLRWSLMRQLVTGLVSTAGALAYTRLLQPEDLGAVALAFLVYGGLYLLIQAPIRDAIVYYQEREEAHGSAAFWLLLGFSASAVSVVMAAAGLLGRFYDSPAAAALTRGMAMAFFLQALAVVPAALLLKRFRFAVHEILQTVLVLIFLVGWVVLALTGWGPWSLVLPQIVGTAFWAVAVWIAAGFRPILRPGRDAYRAIVRFSRSLLGSKLIVYLRASADNAAVGTLGAGALGWYSFGEDQSGFAVLSVGLPVGQVALPAMAAVQDKMAQVRRIYADMLRLTATLSTPMQIGAIVVADLGIALFFGEQWVGAVPVFQAYLAFRLVDTLLAVSDAVTSALGRPELRLRVDLIQLPLFLGGIWFGLRVWGGIAGVAWSLAVVRTLMGLVYLGVTMHLTRLDLGRSLRYLGPSTLAGMLMGLGVVGLRRTGVAEVLAGSLRPSLLADGVWLALLVLTGVVGYFSLLYALDRSGFKKVMTQAGQIAVPEGVRTRLLATRAGRKLMRWAEV